MTYKMMKCLLFLTLIVVVATESLLSQNIMIANTGNVNEPSLMMDFKNPHILVAGSNLNYRFVSTDTGRTWDRAVMNSTWGVWGDPVIIVDTAGSFYYFHLSNPSEGSWIDRIVCQKSANSGGLWTDGSYMGKNGAKAQDKPWAVVNRKTNEIYVTWTQFDKYGSANPMDSSIILFSRSADGGDTWTAPVRINRIAGDCIDDDLTVEGAVPAVGPNGEIYVSWAGPAGLVFNRSLDGGITWLAEEIAVDSMPGGWNYEIPGIMRANGLPVTICDTGNSPYRGTIYINWSDQRNGVSNTDVWLSKSTDGGQTWSKAVRVNNDATENHQFFTWIAVNQSNGWLYFVFYDRRNYSSDSTDVYLAISKDGGVTFQNVLLSETPFLPNKDIFFGDYTNIVAYNGIVRPIWTRLNNGQLSLWTDVTPLEELTALKEKKVPTVPYSFENFPNPSSDYVYVSYKLYKSAVVNLELINTSGIRVFNMISSEKKDMGRYIERIDLNSMNCPPGIYFLRLTIDDQVIMKRQIWVK